MVTAIFRTRLHPGNEDEYQKLVEELLPIAESLPGFISMKSFFSTDGEGLSIHEWESAEHLRVWREHPRHLEAQQIGREKYYDEYTLKIFETQRESSFVRV